MASARSPPTSPAAHRLTSPPPASPPKALKPQTPEKPKSTATASPKSASKPEAVTPEKKLVEKKPAEKKDDEPKDDGPDETIPDPSTEPDIDEGVFSQITEMDDDDPDCEFSREIVVDYFKQAATTFEELRTALKDKDLATLSAKGHFLKGSSAALGVKKVQESCEHVQHYGAKRDEIAGVDLTEKQSLRRIALIMPRLEHDYDLAEKWLRDYYLQLGIELEETGK